jgi:Tfp pilus assembly protein PilN
MSQRAVNLLPRRRQEAYRGAARLRAWGISLAAYAALVIVASMAARLSWGNDLRPMEADADALAAKVRAGEAQLATARAKLRTALAREATVRRVLDRPDWGDLLGVVARRLGDEIVLRDVRVRAGSETSAATAAGAPKTAAGLSPERVSRLELRGLGRSQAAVAKFVSGLEAMRLFDQVRLVRTGREPFGTGTTATSFELECTMTDGGRP